MYAFFRYIFYVLMYIEINCVHLEIEFLMAIAIKIGTLHKVQ